MIDQSRLHIPERSEIGTSDCEAVRRFLRNTHRTPVRVECRASDSHDWAYAHTRLGNAPFAIDCIEVRGEVTTSAEQLSDAFVLCTLTGRVQCRTHDYIAVVPAGDIVLASGTDGVLHMRMTDAKVLAVAINQTVLMDVIGYPDVRFSGVTPVSQAAAHNFRDIASFVNDSLLTDDDRATPLVMQGAGRLLAAAALEAFPVAANPSHEHFDDLKNASPSALRRAIDYVEENAGKEIGIGEIAAAVYLTPRTVQYMFRRYLETTPTAYLRHIRLERAQRDLAASDRALTTVAATAARWGFAHTGRFAVQYREMFGESPHETLRK